MSYIFWSYANSKIDLGFIDARYCPNCKRRDIHEGIKHHKHFILVVPFYLSNRFYSYCIHCGQTTLLVGDERKYVKKLNKNAVKFFKTNEKLNTFLLDLMDMCRKYDVIDGDKINEQNLNKVIGLVKDKYSVIHKNKYEDRFYKDMTICCAESVLRVEKEKKEN